MVNNPASGAAIPEIGGILPMQEFRLPLAPRILSLVTTLIVGAISLGMVALAIGLFIMKYWLLAILIALVAAILIELTRYVFRDLSGKWSLRVRFNPEALELFLPANRSLIHATPRQQLSIRYSDIAAVETRLEAYASMGMANMQRPYVLRLASGERVYLFEERALGTGLQSSFYGSVVDAIINRAGVPIDDLGMTEGGNGVLGVWGTKAADWASPALSKSAQQRLWAKAIGTGRMLFFVIILAIAVRAALQFL